MFWLKTKRLLVISSSIIHLSLWEQTQWIIKEKNKEDKRLRDGCGKRDSGGVGARKQEWIWSHFDMYMCEMQNKI